MNPAPGHATPDTRGHIMDLAERLFAENGFNATSLRDITQAAAVNLAAVNYHFGSKDNLIVEVIRRGINPINEERLRRLHALPVPSGLETILEAFFRPAFEHLQNPKREHFCRLMGRCLHETGQFTEELIRVDWLPILGRFLDALAPALPKLPRHTLLWRFHFCVGSMIFTLSQHQIVEKAGNLPSSIRENFEPQLDQLISYSAAGLRAPVP